MNLTDGIRGNRCYIDEPLDGEIDLSPLKNKDIEEIHFVDGTISQLDNVPRGVKKIVINGNMLEQIPRMTDLVHLEANGNRLSTIDLNNMNDLVSLHVNNNEIRRIHNFPGSLKMLYISGNMLEELDLNSADSCTTVNCQGNPLLQKIISGKQFSDPYFKLEKDPHTVIMRDAIRGGEPKTNIDVKNAVNNYYELKKQYEDSKQKIINDIKNKSISKQKKIKEIRNAQFKCVNCGKNGGTIFRKEDNHLKAICGNKVDPCKLNIKILSSMTLSENDIRETEAEVNVAKQNIIKLKMDTLFGYIGEEESVKNFQKNVEIIKKHIVLENQSFFEMQNDSKKVNAIKKKIDTVYTELNNIRELMAEYNESQNKRLLKDVAAKQLAIGDILTVVRSVKYPIHEVIQESVYNLVDEEGNFVDDSKASKTKLNILKQYPYSFDDFLNPNLEMLKVLKYEQ
jgi:hypothetical protein